MVFRFVDGLPNVGSHLLVDEEEVVSTCGRKGGLRLHEHLFLGAGGLLFSRDLDCTAGTGGPRAALQWLDQCLISACDHLVDGEFERSREIMVSKVLQVLEVVDIIDFNLVVLSLLKVVLDVEGLDPGRAEVVHDDFGHADSEPLSSLLTVEDYHSVCAGESVQIGQVFTCE